MLAYLLLAEFWEPLTEPIKIILTKLGFSNLLPYLNLIALIIYGLLVFIGKFLFSTAKSYIKNRKDIRTLTDLHPTYGEEEIKDYTEIYIAPRFQLYSPSISLSRKEIVTDEKESDKLSFTEVNSKGVLVINRRTIDLFDFFIYDIFKTPRPIQKKIISPLKSLFSKNQNNIKTLSERRFFFVLGDSGMGKTALIINLYLSYIKTWNKKYKMAVIPLSSDNVEIKIRDILEKKNTILLLDALDEDPKASQEVQKRISELIQEGKEFRRVIFTCRTQFFTDEKYEPIETNIRKYGGQGLHQISKLYLSPFSQSDINLFVKKKYRHKADYKIALKLIHKLPDITIRPLVLKYFDDILSENLDLKYKYDLYNLIVKKWINREKYRVDENKRTNFEENLFRFSKHIALHIYVSANKELTISSEEIDRFAEENKISISSLEFKSKSLLNRGENDKYKFSHKSILEFFLAELMYDDASFLMNFKTKLYDAAFSFYKERCEKSHTIPFIRSLVKYNLDRLTDDERAEVIRIVTTNFQINKRTLEVIIWRETSKMDYRLDWSLLEEIESIQITNQEHFDDFKIFIGFQSLRKLSIKSCYINSLEFLKFTNINSLILVSCVLSKACAEEVKSNKYWISLQDCIES